MSGKGDVKITLSIAYVTYVISFYTLTVMCIVCWKVIPGYYRALNERLHENIYADKYMTDVAFKTHIGLYSSLIINLIYVLVNAISGIIYDTYWFGIFAVYYGIIAVMRFLLVRYVNENPIGQNYLGELKRARLCAGILLTVNFALSAAVLMMLFLETAMFAQFGADTSPEEKRILIMATGAGISVAVVVMAIYMIVQTSKEIKLSKK